MGLRFPIRYPTHLQNSTLSVYWTRKPGGVGVRAVHVNRRITDESKKTYSPPSFSFVVSAKGFVAVSRVAKLKVSLNVRKFTLLSVLNGGSKIPILDTNIFSHLLRRLLH